MEWAAAGPGTGRFFAEGDRSVVLVGFKGDGPVIARDRVGISLDSPEFAAVTLSALDDQPLGRSRRILITACSRTENSGQVWNDDRTSLGDRWGEAPTLIEPVVAEIRLTHTAASATLTALSGDGKPSQTWMIQTTDGSFNLSLGDGPATLWYLLECE